jgi:hypothetical protein
VSGAGGRKQEGLVGRHGRPGWLDGQKMKKPYCPRISSVDQALTELLAGKAVSVPETKSYGAA